MVLILGDQTRERGIAKFRSEYTLWKCGIRKVHLNQVIKRGQKCLHFLDFLDFLDCKRALS